METYACLIRRASSVYLIPVQVPVLILIAPFEVSHLPHSNSQARHSAALHHVAIVVLSPPSPPLLSFGSSKFPMLTFSSSSASGHITSCTGPSLFLLVLHCDINFRLLKNAYADGMFLLEVSESMQWALGLIT